MKKKIPTFDECYQAIPKIQDFENFESLWNELNLNIKKKPIEPITKLKFKKTFAKESLYEIQLKGHSETPIKGYLNIPRKLNKVPIVLTLSDYWEEFDNLDFITNTLSQNGIAHMHIFLFDKQKADNYKKNLKNEERNQKHTIFLNPPLFLETYMQNPKEDYNVFLILDILRAIDFIRLNKSLRHDKVGILGRGLGANLAIFAMAFRSESIKVLALERPSLLWIESFLKHSKSQIAEEYKKILKLKSQREKKRSHLFLNEPLYIVDKIHVPIMMSIHLIDMIHPAYPAFGFFNLLQCDKSMQLFTEENKEKDLNKEREVSLNFLIENLKMLK